MHRALPSQAANAQPRHISAAKHQAFVKHHEDCHETGDGGAMIASPQI